MITQKHTESERPDFSILIGVVSTQDSDRILETLESLRTQEGSCSYEVLLADRRNDDISRQLGNYPEVTHIPCPAGMSLPELRDTGTGPGQRKIHYCYRGPLCTFGQLVAEHRAGF